MIDIFSKRSAFATNPIREEDTAAEHLEREGTHVIRLNTGDPAVYMPTPRYIIDAYVRALQEGRTSYSRSEGIVALADAVAHRYSRMYGVDFGGDAVVVTQGISEGLGIINSALIDEGDRACIFRPYYPAYMTNLRLAGGETVRCGYNEDSGWSIDTDEVEKALGQAGGVIKYMLITNPNNPTGTVLGRDVLSELVDIANDHELLIMSDEIYDEIVFNGASFTSIAQLARGVPHVILNGVSKNFDATGFRIGFIVVPEQDETSLALRQKFLDYVRVRLSANTPAEYACAEAFNNVAEHTRATKAMVAEIQDRVNYSVDLLEENEYMSVVRPEGAFYAFPRLDLSSLAFQSDTEFVRGLLDEEHVQITRGSGFGEPSHIRLVCLPPKEILGDAINRINSFCSRHAR